MRTITLLFISIFISSTLTFSQQRDSRTREYLSPTRIMWQNAPDQFKNVESLLKEGNGQSDLINNGICTAISTDEATAAILLDFGKELQGGLQIVTGMTHPNRPVKIRVRFGESASEAMCDISDKPVNGATNDHAMRDFFIEVPWLGVAEVGNSGFRFVRIDIIDKDINLNIKEIRAISTFRDIPYIGSFISSDERLNNIWHTGAYTVHLNMQEYLWDGIKRDRLVWIGDLHPEVMSVCSVFGYNEVVPKSLDLIRDITPMPEWMNGISSYSIWWLLIHRDWYFHHGDLKYLKEQQEYLTALVELIISKVDKDGGESLNGNRFLDWPSNANRPAINGGLQALTIEAMIVGEELLSILGDKSLAKRCNDTYNLLLKGAEQDKEELLKSTLAATAPGQKQAAALLSLAGVLDPIEADKKFISVGGANGFSTFYGYYMLQAMAKGENYTGALDIIRNYWGAMIDLGATTFWEDFDIKWIENGARIDELVPEGEIDVHRTYGNYCYKGFRHSLCHGWASGPTAWLSRFVLGVEVLEPGCRTVRIVPNLGDLEWVKGSYPTPLGPINIEHYKKSDGTISSKIDAPKGVKVVRK